MKQQKNKHNEKVKMARKMQNKEELKKKGEGIFESDAWLSRRNNRKVNKNNFKKNEKSIK